MYSSQQKVEINPVVALLYRSSVCRMGMEDTVPQGTKEGGDGMPRRVERIDHLTDEQIALLPRWAEMWTQIGLSCEPLNLPRAKRAVTLAYEAANRKPPRHFVVCDGPVSAAITASILKQGASAGASVGDSVRASVRDSVWDSVGEQRYGSHDAHWIGYYSLFFHACGLKCVTSLRGLMQLGRYCGWWAPYENVAILQHRHCELHRNEDGRLHNEAGMSVKYRDGWGVWSIGGVTVDEQIVMQPESQTVEQIGGEQNEEMKRIRIERFGWERYLGEVNANVIDTRRNDVEATTESLMRADGMTLLVCACPSTGRTYALEVEPAIETCETAQQWLRGGKKLNLIGAS